MDKSLDDFIESMLNEKGVTNLTPEIRNKLKEDMQTRLIDQINKAAIMQLSEEKAAELAQLVDDPNFTGDQVTEFMQNSGVDLQQVALDTMLRFRSLYLNSGE